jgi:hypothetical protein
MEMMLWLLCQLMVMWCGRGWRVYDGGVDVVDCEVVLM